MKLLVEFAVAGGLLGFASALVAQESESAVAKVVVPAPESVSGLALQFELMQTDEEPRLAGRFARFSDVTLFLRMRNTGTSPLLLAIDEASRRWVAVPELLAIELTRDDGAPLSLPAFEVATFFDNASFKDDNWYSLPVRSVTAGNSLDWSIPLREVPGWQSIELAPGAYRIRATYRGPPDLSAQPNADAGAKSAWRGAVGTSTLRFEITEPTPALTWSEPREGMRIAPIPDPRGDLFMFGETIELLTMLENATDQPLVLVREVDYSQDDGLAITAADGTKLSGGGFMTTGINHRVRFTLPAHARLRIHAAPAKFGPGRIAAGNRSFDSVGPGRYTLRQSIEIESPRPPDRKFLDVPVREVELLARR